MGGLEYVEISPLSPFNPMVEEYAKPMMNYGSFGMAGGMMFFGWIVMILSVVLLVLGIAALWKYINKK